MFIMTFLAKISHWFCWSVGGLLFKFFFDFKVNGNGQLKNLKGPMIIAFNHSTWLDPFFIQAAISPKTRLSPIHFATWYQYYWFFLPFTAMAGAFPVKRGVELERTLEKGILILKKSGIVGIAPEGKRRRFGRPRGGRRGLSFLAFKTKSPILPVYIDNAIGISFSDFLRRRRKIKCVIGKPFNLSYSEKEPDFKKLSNSIMKIIYQLRNA